MYDYLIVGAGLFGSVFAYEAGLRGKQCLVIEKRNHIGGNIYTEQIENIDVHTYGAHIFHTSSKRIWDYINQFSEFNHFINSPIAIYQDEVYNLPFNMNTFNKLWGTKTPIEAQEKLKEQTGKITNKISQNLEEQAIKLVGEDIYFKLIKGYTEKQWGKECKDLPAFIIKRIPVRFTYNNNYFDDPYQGIPKQGYTAIIEQMLKNADVELNLDYSKHKKDFEGLSNKVIYTGMIDNYYDYCFGALEYRSLHFENEIHDCSNLQGNAVVNYTHCDIPYTRIIEHKHFTFGSQEKTVITKEYPVPWTQGLEAYYPINDDKNNLLFKKYQALAQKENNMLFGGRLGQYKYFNMDQTIAAALSMIGKEFKE